MKEKKKEIEKQMLSLYEEYQGKGENLVTDISYYNQIIMQNSINKTMYGIQNIYYIKLYDSKEIEKNKIVLYQDGKEIATIDNNSKIQFSQEYIYQMKKISPEIYNTLKQINGQSLELLDKKDNLAIPNIKNEEEVEDFSLSKEELEEQKNLKEEQEESLGQKENDEGHEETKNEEENIERIARKSGLTKDDIKSCSTIDPQEKITDDKSFEDIANIEGKYTKIFVVSANNESKGNSRFAFWGITPDGQVKQIEGLEERQGVNTGKTIYAINRDGSEVKEQQTAALFTMPNQKEGFSVTIGQYGIIETTYIRRSPEENKFIGSEINSSTQKPTTREVQEFMNDSRTTDRELQKTIDKTEHQLSETEKTNIKNIDNNPNNDVAIDMDAKIEMHDGTATTLREEAEKFDIPPEEYAKIFGETIGDCPSDKIEEIRMKHAPQD
ncbi:MAG: hypothetical protein ACI4VC_00960, partial [Clostridia bacterium]